jgi:hypothetical protein
MPSMKLYNFGNVISLSWTCFGEHAGTGTQRHVMALLCVPQSMCWFFWK